MEDDRATEALVARQLHAWRKRQGGLTAQQLADRVAAAGGKLTRQAISKIENGDRGVSIDEFFVLARALDVPPALLLVDLQGSEPISQDEGEPQEAWSVLLSLVGRQSDHWTPHAFPIRDALKLTELVDSIENNQHNEISLEVLPNQDGAEERRRLFDESDRARLRHLAHLLGNFPRHGVPAPTVPAYVVRRASELGIELPERQERPQGERPDQGD